jgi:hypothetical protein
VLLALLALPALFGIDPSYLTLPRLHPPPAAATAPRCAYICALDGDGLKELFSAIDQGCNGKIGYLEFIATALGDGGEALGGVTKDEYRMLLVETFEHVRRARSGCCTRNAAVAVAHPSARSF